MEEYVVYLRIFDEVATSERSSSPVFVLELVGPPVTRERVPCVALREVPWRMIRLRR